MVINEYNGYQLKKYDGSDKLRIVKHRPYDDADYYTAFTEDLKTWYVVYKCHVVEKINGATFEEAVRRIEDKNQTIKPKMCHY